MTIQRERIASNVCGIPLVSWDRDGIVDHVFDAVHNGERTTLYYLNAHCVNVAVRDHALKEVLLSDGLVYADGQSVVWASRLFGEPVPERAATTDLFPQIVERAACEGKRLFFLGAAPGVAERCAARMRDLYPGVLLAGVRDGYFDANDDRDVIAAINHSGADVVFVGLGVPRQETWVARNRDAIEAPVVMTCGGCFDFHSGDRKRAPAWMQRAGLEWLFRMALEPRRLWRRYLIGNAAFLWNVVRHRL